LSDGPTPLLPAGLRAVMLHVALDGQQMLELQGVHTLLIDEDDDLFEDTYRAVIALPGADLTIAREAMTAESRSPVTLWSAPGSDA